MSLRPGGDPVQTIASTFIRKAVFGIADNLARFSDEKAEGNVLPKVAKIQLWRRAGIQTCFSLTPRLYSVSTADFCYTHKKFGLLFSYS